MKEETKRFFISETVALFIFILFGISLITIRITEYKMVEIIWTINYFLCGFLLFILTWYGFYKLMEKKNEHTN